MKTTRTWQLGVSFLFALVMWLNFSGRFDQEQPESVRVFSQIPISQENLASNLKMRADTYQVSVTLSGLEREIKNLNPSSDIKIRLDLKGFQPGTYNVELQPRHVNLPDKLNTLKVTNLFPDILRITLIEYATKRVEIIQPVEGQPAVNFEIRDVLVIPNFVTVNGPAAQVRDLRTLTASPVKVSNLSRSLEGQVQLDFSRQIPRDVAIQELGSLRYKIQIEEKRVVVNFKNPLMVTSPDPGYKFEPSKVRLSIRVPLSLARWFQPSWVVPEVLVPEQIVGEQEKGRQVPERQKTSVSTKWRVPDEILEMTPDWKTRIDRIEIRWEPSEVEVR